MSVKTICESKLVPIILNCNESAEPLKQKLVDIKSIDWTADGQEPNIVRALLLNQLFENKTDLQQDILKTLLPFATHWQKSHLKQLLTKNTVPIHFQRCVEHFNKLKDENQAEFYASQDQVPESLLQDLQKQRNLRFPILLFSETKTIGAENAEKIEEKNTE